MNNELWKPLKFYAIIIESIDGKKLMSLFLKFNFLLEEAVGGFASILCLSYVEYCINNK